MFSVFLDQVNNGCASIQQVAIKQNIELQNLEQVISGVSALSGMEQVIGSLNGKKSELERQQQSLLDMLQGLEKIRLCYQNAELRNYENAEGCRLTQNKPNMQVQTMTFANSKVQTVPFKV